MENESRKTKVAEEFDECCICGGTLQNGYANLFVDSSGYAARIDKQCHNAIDSVVHGKDARTIQSSLEYLSKQREYVHPAVQRYIDSYIQHGEQRLLTLRNTSIVLPSDRHQHYLRPNVQDTENARRNSSVSRVSDSSETATIIATQHRMPALHIHGDSRTRNVSNSYMDDLPSNAAGNAHSTASANESKDMLDQPCFLRQSTVRTASTHRASTSRRKASNDYTNDEQKSDLLQENISAIRERINRYDPSTPVKSTRSLIALILLSVLTLFLYAIFFWIGYCRDLNRICNGDGKHTFNIGIAYALGWIIGLIIVIVMLITSSLDVILGLFGIFSNPIFIMFASIGFIAMCIWVVTTQNRIVSNGHRYHARITKSGGTVLAWQTVGILVFGFGPLIAQFIMVDSLNHLADAYNQESNLY